MNLVELCLKKMKSPTHCLHMLLPPNKKWTTTSEIVNPMFYPSVPPVHINVLLLTGACLIYNSFVFIVSIVLSLYRLCTLSCTCFVHVCCVNSIKYEYESIFSSFLLHQGWRSNRDRSFCHSVCRTIAVTDVDQTW